MRKYTSAARMPLWKWILCLVFGAAIFLGLYIGSQYACGALTTTWWQQALFLVFAGLVGLFLYAVWTNLTERRPVTELSMKRFLPGLGGGFLLGLVYFGCVVGIMALLGAFRITEAHFDAPMMLQYLAYFFLVAVFEEIVFRGVLFRLIDDRWNTFAAVIVSALVFGAVHLMNPGATLWSAVAIAIEAGLLFGIVYKCSGNLWVPIGIHWAWNFVQGPVLGFAVSGNGVEYKVFSTILTGSDWVTGGVFGAEAAVPTVVLGLLLTVLLLLFSKRERR
jgi:Predicted metal-dependent membrane protease